MSLLLAHLCPSEGPTSGDRTRTPFRALGFKPSVSANSTIDESSRIHEDGTPTRIRTLDVRGRNPMSLPLEVKNASLLLDTSSVVQSAFAVKLVFQERVELSLATLSSLCLYHWATETSRGRSYWNSHLPN